MFYSKAPVEERLKKAFSQAAELRDTLKGAVDGKFEPVGSYTSTNVWALQPLDFALLIISAFPTLGISIVAYELISRHNNAKNDEYRLDPARHFGIAAAKLDAMIEDLPNIPEKEKLARFRREIEYAFRMEKSAQAITSLEPEVVARGLKDIGKALPFSDAATISSLQEAYRQRRFPGPGSFAKEVGDFKQTPAAPPPRETTRGTFRTPVHYL